MKNNDSRVLFAPGSITPPDDAPILVADGLRTPENVGALVRLAANVGCKSVVVLNSGEMNVSKIKRTACMAWDYVQIVRATTAELTSVVPGNYELVAIETSSVAQNIFSAELPRRVALVVGSEVHGVSNEVLALCRSHLYIPMTGPDTSMNVSQAAAVALFDWVRRFVQ